LRSSLFPYTTLFRSSGANVLVAIFGEKDSHAVYYLHQQGVSRLDVVNFMSHGITKQPQMTATPMPKDQPAQADSEARQSPLEQRSKSTRLNSSHVKI